MSGIQRGSVLYTQIYPGDPLTPGEPRPEREAPGSRDAANLPLYSHHAHQFAGRSSDSLKPRRTACPARMAGWSAIHLSRRARATPRAHEARLMDYQQRPIYDVIAKLSGTNDDEWVILGNHHDAWVLAQPIPAAARPRCSKRHGLSANWFAPAGNRGVRS